MVFILAHACVHLHLRAYSRLRKDARAGEWININSCAEWKTNGCHVAASCIIRALPIQTPIISFTPALLHLSSIHLHFPIKQYSERERKTDKRAETERQRERHTHADTETERQRETDKQMGSQTDRQGDSDRWRQAHRLLERHRDGDRQTGRFRQTDREREGGGGGVRAQSDTKWDRRMDRQT